MNKSNLPVGGLVGNWVRYPSNSKVRYNASDSLDNKSGQLCPLNYSDIKKCQCKSNLLTPSDLRFLKK